MDKQRPIGVFDSGIGGLSVLKQFIRYLPQEKYIYLGDTGRVPYGNKSTDTVRRYSRECAEFLMSKDVKLIVIACNTASSLALETVKEISNVPVIGMIGPAVSAAIRETSNGNIGIIGTRATVSSNSYNEAIKQLDKKSETEVFSKACPLFVPIAEEGWTSHPAARMIAEEYLAEFKAAEVDTLVLGCTHYPLLKQLISEVLPGVTLIDSGEHASVTALRVLAEKGVLVEENPELVSDPYIDFYVTDVASTFFEIARRFLGFEVEKPHIIQLGKQ
jgi:glutamate racemase